MRSSNHRLDFRKLLVDVKQWKGYGELAFELLAEVSVVCMYLFNIISHIYRT
jgi:hypothetical protein